MEPAPDDPVTLGRFRVVSRLGAGGMGRVLLGVDDAGQQVALKIVHAALAEDPGFRERFRREVQMAASAPAWFTAPVIDADPEATRPWLATAYIEGPSLHAYVAEQGPLGEAPIAELAVRLADGLAALHAGGLVHRDLKPSNVLLADDGPRVIDFGISRAANSTSLTQTGQLLGTPAFMSPEQAAGERNIGPPSDMFSFGALIVHAATGASPFAAKSTAGALHRILLVEPDLGPLTGRVREVVQACLAKDPAARPSAVRVRDRLREGEQTEMFTRPTVAAEPAPLWPPAYSPTAVLPPPTRSPQTVPAPNVPPPNVPPPSRPPQNVPSPSGPPSDVPPPTWRPPDGSLPNPPPGSRRPARSWLPVVAIVAATLVGAGIAIVAVLLLNGPSVAPIADTGTSSSGSSAGRTAAVSTDPAAGATVIDSPADARFGTDQANFATPSGNIACLMTTGEVRCDVTERSWTLPPTPTECQQAFGTGTVLAGSGPGALSCVGDSVVGPSLPVLAYGEAVRFEGVVCVSRETGMRCEKPATGHGFRVSRATYELF